MKTIDIKTQVGDQYIGLECASKKYILHWVGKDGSRSSRTLRTDRGYKVRSLKVAMKQFAEAIEAAKTVTFTKI